MLPLTIQSLTILEAGATSPTADHIRASLARGLPEFTPAITFNDGHFVVVGSGPSVTSFLDDIRRERVNGRPICAVKGAHDWLCENALYPDLFVSMEPRERPLKHVNDRTTYLVASRCPPSLFESVSGKQCVIWHSAASKPGAEAPKKEVLEWDDLNMLEECEEWRGRFGVGGGTTSGIRAIYIGFLLGFRKFILYGFDSCLASDRDTKRFTGEKVGTGKLFDVIVGGRRFWCNGALAQQAIEFQKLYELPNISIEAKGDGLIPAILAHRRKCGYPA